MDINQPKKFDSSNLFSGYKKQPAAAETPKNNSADISSNSFSTAFQNKVFFYFILISATILAVLKMPMAQIYYSIVQVILTFAPFIVILVMAIVALVNFKKYPDYRNIIRKFYLTFTLKFVLAILIFYFLYAPTLFIEPIIAAIQFFHTIATLEGLFYFLSYLSILVIAIAIIFIAFRTYQKTKGTYDGSIQFLTRRTLYTLFFFFILMFGASAVAYPEAYKPLTDTLGDAIYTLSAGNVQVLKGSDLASYNKIKSLGEFATSLSASIAQTSKNVSESNQEYKTTLDQARQDLQSSIAASASDLKSKINNDLGGKFSTENGTVTISGDIVSEGDLDMKGNIISGMKDPINLQDAANKKYVDEQITLQSFWQRSGTTISQLNADDNLNLGGSSLTAGYLVLTGELNRGTNAIIGIGDLGSATGYIGNVYNTRSYLNATAYLDGTTSGKMIATGQLDISQISAKDSDGLKIYDDGGNGISIRDGGQIVIGGATNTSTIAPLTNVVIGNGNGGSMNSARGGLMISSGYSSESNSGISASVIGGGAGNSVTGISGFAQSSSAASLIKGISSGVNPRDNITDVISFESGGFIGNANNTSVTNLYSFKDFVFLYTSGTVNNRYGAYLSNPLKVSGTLNNNYGIYIENQTAGTNNYSIYSAGGTNYFAGNVGIANSAPDNYLSIGSNINNGFLYGVSIGIAGAATSPRYFTVGQSTTRSVSLGWNYAASTSFAYATLSTNGYGNPLYVDVKNLLLQSASGTGNVGIGTATPTALFQVAQMINGLGTVSNSAGGTTITGSGTQFTNTFKVGDTITIAGETVSISAITSDTSMTTTAIASAHTASTYSLTGGTRLSVLGNGNVGIGDTTPDTTLKVAGSLCVKADGNNCAGSTAGTIYATTTTVAGADYAEYFETKDQDLQSGEVVCIDNQNENAVKRCKNSGDSNVMGIVSFEPSVVGNSAKLENNRDKTYKIIALLGQIPAKITNENGGIQIGDSLTSASTPGYIRKANSGESTVGVALQNFNDDKGTIQVLISRKNKSLTVDAVETQVTERIAQMNIQDQVDAIIANSQKTLEENLNTRLTSLEQRQTELSAIIEAQIKELKNLDLISAKIDLNNTELENLKTTLGLEYITEGKEITGVNIGTTDLIKKLKAQTTETGKLIISINDEDAKTIGSGTIKAGDTSVEIKTTAVNEDSKVFVTPKIVIDKTLSVIEIKNGESFKVSFKAPTLEEGIPFDWWIVEENN